MGIEGWCLVLLGLSMLWLLLDLKATKLEVALLAEMVHALKSCAQRPPKLDQQDQRGDNLADRHRVEVERRAKLRENGVVRKPLGGFGD